MDHSTEIYHQALDYEKDIGANFDDLLNRLKSVSYVEPPVRRHYIPKADGTKRPLGIPTFEDIEIKDDIYTHLLTISIW